MYTNCWKLRKVNRLSNAFWLHKHRIKVVPFLSYNLYVCNSWNGNPVDWRISIIEMSQDENGSKPLFFVYQFVNPTSKGAGKKSLMDLDHIERCASPSGSCENDRSLLKLHLHREYEPCSHVSKSSLNSSISPRSARYKVVFIKKITLFWKEKMGLDTFKMAILTAISFFKQPKDIFFRKVQITRQKLQTHQKKCWKGEKKNEQAFLKQFSMENFMPFS